MHPVSRSGPNALTGVRSTVLLPLVVAASALIGRAYVANVDPNVAGHYPTCPILAVTGWYCPGCGTLRAVHALAQSRCGIWLIPHKASGGFQRPAGSSFRVRSARPGAQRPRGHLGRGL